MASMKLRLPAGAAGSAVVSAAMIAQQVAGKATRDTLYLTSFDVTTLPLMMAASAVLSILSVLWLSKMILRHSPARTVPASFAVSCVVLLAAWGLSFPAPRLAAVAVYAHTALFGATLISAFWSFVSERFDPHTGKRAVGFIAGAGTLGGLVGGVLAWRASSVIAVSSMLPLLAAMNLVCLWGSLRSRDSQTLRSAGLPVAGENGRDQNTEGVGWVSIAKLSPLLILREAPYLRNLALVVALGAVTVGLLDYVFRAEAVEAYANGPDLLAFFALFWLAVGVLSLTLQVTLGRIALEKLGLAVTIALLPGVVVLGGVFGLAVPGLWSTAILRGGEAAQRNSLFRAAYELLYTPLSEQKRRSTKLLIDVGFDRLGTVAASAIAFLTLQFQQDGERGAGVLLVVAVACALVTLTRSRSLQMNYVAVLEESLRRETERAEPRVGAFERPATRESRKVRDLVVEQLQHLPHTVDLAALAAAQSKDPAAPLEAVASVPADVMASLDVSLQAIHALASGSPKRVRRFFRKETPLAAPLVPLAIGLLESKAFHLDAIRALRKVARKSTGQLADALCDPSVGFDIRRRIPRVLSACPTQAAADALIRGTEDERFEVRYECSRALLRITAAEPAIVISRETVIAIVGREVAQSKEVWNSQCAPEFDEEKDEPPALIGRLLRDRFDRSFEYVFSILALVLDRESIRIAFKALHQEDTRLRGTALEYLEILLPDEIRAAVWPFLGEARPMRPGRPAEEILADLLNAGEVSKVKRDKS
jgi:AAA family ATP:ADP antiporter